MSAANKDIGTETSTEHIDQRIDELEQEKRNLIENQSYLRRVNEFSSDLLNAKSIDDVLWIVTTYIIDKFGFEDCVVYLLGDDGTAMEKVASHSVDEYPVRVVKTPLTIPLGEGIVGTVGESGKPELISDTRLDDRYIIDDASRLSELTVPIINEGKVIGVIDTENEEANYYTEDHLETLVAIANLTAAKIGNLIVSNSEKKARQEVEENESRIKNILNNALDAVVVIDEDGVVTFWNKQAEKIFKWKAKEVIGEKLVDLILPKEGKRVFKLGLKEVNQKKKSRFLNKRIEIDLIRKNDEIFNSEFTVTPLNVKKTMFFSVFARDISQRIKDEQMLQHQNSELERINSELERFVYNVTHDLKSPLSNLQGLMNLIETEKDVSKLPPMFGVMSNSIQKMSEFIEELLAYSRNANADFTTEEIDLKLFFSGVIEEHRFMEGASDIDFKMNIPSSLIIRTDANRLRIVINNLVSNAIKYHDLSKEKPFVKIHGRIKKNEVIIQVEDNGLGISKADQKKIFNMFFRITSYEKKASGTGVGLYILKETLNKLGGEIAVQSSKGKGTTFTISLPQ